MRESLSVCIGALQKKDSAWAEPHNKNPLEKTTLSRQGITAQSKEMKDEGMVRIPVHSVALLYSYTWHGAQKHIPEQLLPYSQHYDACKALVHLLQHVLSEHACCMPTHDHKMRGYNSD